LKKGHISEMKALTSPSASIALTSNIVLTMLGEKMSFDESKKETMWKKATNSMANPD
jgi:hypothetical protein